MVIIIGGGISGLAAAHELARRRIPFRLLEASSRVGGLIRTEHRDGFTIDAGADAFLTSKPAARDLCAEVGLTPDLQEMNAPRSAFVLADGRLCPLPSPSVLGLPLTAAAAIRFDLLPVRARVRLLLERFVPASSAPDESIASFFRRRFGSATVRLVAQPLLGGIHAGDVERLSVRSLFPTLIAAETAGSVLRTQKARRPEPRATFTALSGGMETLPKTVAEALPRGAVTCNAEVSAIARSEDAWLAQSTRGRESASAILLATPLPVTARLLHTIAPRAAELCRQIPHASSVSIALAWRRAAIPHPLRGSGFVVARGTDTCRITACTWVTSKWDGRAPSGYAVLRAFMGGVHDPAAVALPDEELVATATRDLRRVLGIAAPPEWARVYRWHDASPQLEVGHEDRLQGITAALERHAGVFVTGRGLRAVGIPDCISDARRVASLAAAYVSRSHGDAKIDEHARR